MRRTTMVAAALMLVIALAACGTDKKATATSSAADTTAEIQLTDYAYSVTGTPTAGGTLRLRNTGTEMHMMGVGKLKAGKTIEDVRTALKSDDDTAVNSVLDERSLPGGLISPGHAVELTTTALDPGSYAMICFLPVEGVGEPHFARGMVGALNIGAGTPTRPTTDADYQVAPGKAITGPTELKAGHHVFHVSAAAGSEGLEPALAKLPDGKTFDEVFTETNTTVDAAFSAETGPPKGLGKQVAETLYWALHDFKDVTELSVGVDLEPGTYVLAAPDTDLETQPASQTNYITIKVT
jgi:uncharacterized cupredoxin-like copper-binding protein